MDGDERSKTALERVKRLFKERPWVIGEVIETVKNGEEDAMGIDLFVPIYPDLLSVLGIATTEKGVPVQVKSCDRAVMNFLTEKKIFFEGRFEFEDGKYIFTFNGQNPSELIVADIVGQMLALSRGKMTEEEFLTFLSEQMGDEKAVESWWEQCVAIEDAWWYRNLIAEM